MEKEKYIYREKDTDMDEINRIRAEKSPAEIKRELNKRLEEIKMRQIEKGNINEY